MRLNLKKLEEPVWVEWKHGVSFLIVPVSLSKMNKIASKVSKSERFLVRGQRHEKVIDSFNFDKYIGEVADLVQDWKGMDAEDGNPLPFDRNTLIELLNYYVEPRKKGEEDEDEDEDRDTSLLGFIIEKAQEVARSRIEIKEESLGNS